MDNDNDSFNLVLDASISNSDIAIESLKKSIFYREFIIEMIDKYPDVLEEWLRYSSSSSSS